jgi:hypothetical protein
MECGLETVLAGVRLEASNSAPLSDIATSAFTLNIFLIKQEDSSTSSLLNKAHVEMSLPHILDIVIVVMVLQ